MIHPANNTAVMLYIPLQTTEEFVRSTAKKALQSARFANLIQLQSQNWSSILSAQEALSKQLSENNYQIVEPPGVRPWRLPIVTMTAISSLQPRDTEHAHRGLVDKVSQITDVGVSVGYAASFPSFKPS